MKSILIIFALLCLGCDRTQEKCQDEIEDVKYYYGEPDSIIHENTINVQNVKLVFHRVGLEYTFSFGTLVDGCDVTVRHIKP